MYEPVVSQHPKKDAPLVELSSTVAREFSRRRLTPALAIRLAEEALRCNRIEDSKRLISIAFDLYDFAAAEEDRDS